MRGDHRTEMARTGFVNLGQVFCGDELEALKCLFIVRFGIENERRRFGRIEVLPNPPKNGQRPSGYCGLTSDGYNAIAVLVG